MKRITAGDLRPRVSAGMVVLGAARIRHGSMQPLYETEHVNRDVVVHWHFINESLALFLFFFLQLAVMATYINHDLVKLVPLLTIVFSFGRYGVALAGWLIFEAIHVVWIHFSSRVGCYPR